MIQVWGYERHIYTLVLFLKKKNACSCCPKILVDLKICDLISSMSLKVEHMI
jgi:hypothetical protein